MQEWRKLVDYSVLVIEHKQAGRQVCLISLLLTVAATGASDVTSPRDVSNVELKAK